MSERIVRTLLGLDDEEFKRFVLSHLGPDEPKEIWDALCARELALRTSAVVKKALIEVVEQIRLYRRGRDMRPRDLVERHASSSDWHRRAAGWQRLLAARDAQLAEIRRRAHEAGARLASRSERVGGPVATAEPTRGTSHMVAVALLALDLRVVSRTTIRALIPNEDAFGIGRLGVRIKKAYSYFESQEWVKRLDGDLVQVIDPEGLLGHLSCARSVVEEDALTLLRLADAAAEVARTVETATDMDSLVEVRRQELIALKRLMETGRQIGVTQTHPVRLLPRGKVL